MPSNSATVRHLAMEAPVLLLAYGLLRLIDGLDGARGPGLVWTLAHMMFFAAMVLFGVLAAAVRPLVPAGARTVATVAAGAVVAGVACFLWVIAGDLSVAFREAAPLPEPLWIAGPLLFSLGLLALLGLLVAARRVPVWSPLLLGAGVAAIIIDIDFLPPAALILLAALSPLARPAREGSAGTLVATENGRRARGERRIISA
ncbi:hypothetical protein QLQ12_00755 [Actinoplanes sp. NEAU-A12]|uniref:Low temperature requirement protein A n=1 Tax=Actinoplanes sandaracinus TaxID=3045177 RepID=A0ABT6WBM3_9ACTN|nr:hypothetical protein [Actinoplanes sandaracinus]MDI6097137.1 hypothetical protein [Actinoplanes sandaracinus]